MLKRRISAAAFAAALLTLVACDIWIASFRAWWYHHSLTGSIVSSLLVLGVAGLVVDEIVARRQLRERAATVAVQAIIVYGQARRASNAVLVANAESNASDEARTLASMLLTASPSLFDDPVARLFLEDVQRLAGELARALAPPGAPSDESKERLAAQMRQVHSSAGPLVARLPAEYRRSSDDEATFAANDT
jgi:hypothetical protein